MFSRTFFLVLALLFLKWPALAETVTSPDGRLALTIETVTTPSNAGSQQLVYRVSFRGAPLVEPSALRLELQGQRPLGPDLHIAKATPSSHDETYHLVTGKASEVRDHYNALRIDLEESGDFRRSLAIEARAYDDAVAFRYVVPEQNTLRNFRLTKESTEFRIAKDATTYALILPNFHSMYESEFVKLPIKQYAE